MCTFDYDYASLFIGSLVSFPVGDWVYDVLLRS